MADDPYRVLGRGYATRRTTDPRIAAHLARALVGCSTVVDVGSGTGSYQHPRAVLAVEPSATMIARRPVGSTRVVRAVAEALPLPDDAVDGTQAVLTVHHWARPEVGLAELARVSRRQVVLTWDAARFQDFWLVRDYLPEIGAHEHGLATLDRVVAELERHGDVDVTPVPVPADCVDGVLAAHWASPEAYLDPTVRAAASGLAALPDDVLGPALRRLDADLTSGAWHARYADLGGRTELDVGYRLVTCSRPG